MKLKMVIILLILGIIPVEGRGMTPMDFAKGIVLECDGDASIYRFELPEHVYEGLTRPDFADLRIFNGNGEEVPFSLKAYTPGPVVTSRKPPVSLNVFPVYGSKTDAADSSGLKVHIVTDDHGAVIDVSVQEQGGKPSETPSVLFYVLDLSQMEQKPGKLSFEWTNPEDNTMARVRIYESNDLDHWMPLVRSAVIADFKLGYNRLRQDTVALSSYHSDYLKIEITAGLDKGIIKRVTGYYSPLKAETGPTFRWTRVTGRVALDNPSEYLFTLSYHFPVEKVRVHFPQKNTLVRAGIKSRDDDTDEWQAHYTGLLYNMTVKGMNFQASEVDCPVITDRNWLLTLDNSEGGIGKGILEMEMGWHPHTVYFTARGNGPFTLAYGSANAGPFPGRVDPLLKALRPDQEKYLVRDARLQTTIELGGRRQLEPPAKPFPFRRMLLWSILTGGVALCAFMAFSLYRDMKKEQKSG